MYLVKMRCLYLTAKASNITETEVIGQDDKKIGAFSLRHCTHSVRGGNVSLAPQLSRLGVHADAPPDIHSQRQ